MIDMLHGMVEPCAFQDSAAQEIYPASAGCNADGGRNQTLEKFRSNLNRLLIVQSDTERELTRSHDALVHAGKMAAVGRMVASVNHEIKRPLASMQLLVENTLDLVAKNDGAAATDNLQMLLRAVNQLSELSRQLESFSRKSPLNRTNVSVADAVAEARALMAPKINAGGQNVSMRIELSTAFADHDRLKLALVNLLDNALDATADADDRRIEIVAQEEASTATIRVRDHGAGIPERAMGKLFDAFFTTKPAGKGLGLGLALTSEVVAEMRGRLSVRNHPEGGAEFTIRLPLGRALS